MTTIEIRPRFKRQFELPQEVLLERLHTAAQQADSPVISVHFDHHLILKIPIEQQHYWSPQLHLEVESNEEGSLVRGLFGPRPSVWLFFVFLYAFLGAIALFVFITGGAQYSLGQPAPVLWVIPITAVLIGLLYLAAKAGEKLGHEEMQLLYAFMEENIGPSTDRLREQQTGFSSKTTGL